MRAMLGLLRGVARLIVIVVVVLDVAMIWSMLLAFSATDVDGPIQNLLERIGGALLGLFSAFGQPVTLGNGGTWTWWWLVGLVVVTVTGLVLARLVKFGYHLLYADLAQHEGVLPGELIDHAPNRPVTSAGSVRSSVDDAPFGFGDRPPPPPSVTG